MPNPLITTVTSSDGRISFHRVNVSVKDGELVFEPADPVHVFLDPDREPLYSQHPDAGWVSPPYSKLAEMRAIGIEPEFEDRVICKCQNAKKLTSADTESLERYGHAEQCPRRPKAYVPEPVAMPSLPVHAEPAATLDAHSFYASQARAAGQTAKVRTVPAGGLTERQVDDLTSVLGGANGRGSANDGGITVSGALAEIGLDPTKYNMEVIGGQLYKDFGFSMCSRCGTWGSHGAGRSCPGCN